MNKCVEIGNLTKDSELRYSKDNKAICNFTIAVNEGFGDKKTVQYFNIVSFGAEKISQYLIKGTKVAISGKLQNSNYEKDGVKHYKTEIIADNFGGIEFLGGKENSSGNSNQYSAPANNSQGSFDDDITPVDDGDSMPF